jgi:hypothetical protein
MESGWGNFQFDHLFFVYALANGVAPFVELAHDL